MTTFKVGDRVFTKMHGDPGSAGTITRILGAGAWWPYEVKCDNAGLSGAYDAKELTLIPVQPKLGDFVKTLGGFTGTITSIREVAVLDNGNLSVDLDKLTVIDKAEARDAKLARDFQNIWQDTPYKDALSKVKDLVKQYLADGGSL